MRSWALSITDGIRSSHSCGEKRAEQTVAKASKLRERDRQRIFRDRGDAGRELGVRLATEKLRGEIIVLGLPRGGVPVACAVADALDAPVDVLVVRKLGAPFNPELALGSIATGGVTVYNERLLAELGLDEEALAPVREREELELARREHAYRAGKPPPSVAGKTVVLVDDGVATGATMEAGVEAVRALGPERIVVAVPTSSREAAERLAATADQVIALSIPEPYMAVGAWYEVFDQLSDAEVADYLARAERRRSQRPERPTS